jgi:hypothetical protein
VKVVSGGWDNESIAMEVGNLVSRDGRATIRSQVGFFLLSICLGIGHLALQQRHQVVRRYDMPVPQLPKWQD